MKVQPEVAKKYIIYRQWRNTERERKTQMKHIMDGIVAIDKNDVNLSNANMSSHTPAGQMMTFASEVTKDYTYKYLLPKQYAEAHRMGDIIFMTWIIIPPKPPRVSNMTWKTCSNGVSIPRTEASARPSLSKAMPHWLPLSSRPTRTSSTEDKRFRHSTSSCKRRIEKLSESDVTDIAFYMEMKGTPIDEKALTEHVRKHLTSIEPDAKARKAFLTALANEGCFLTEEESAHILHSATSKCGKTRIRLWKDLSTNLNTMHSRGGNQVVSVPSITGRTLLPKDGWSSKNCSNHR